MKYKNYLSLTILLIILIFFTQYIYEHFEEFKQLTVIPISNLIILIILNVILYFSISRRLDILTEAFGIKLGFLEAFILSIVTGFYNLITPLRGGAVVRAVYLKKKYQFTYTNFVATMYGMYVITFFVAALTGLFSLYWLYLSSTNVSPVLFFLFFGVFVSLGSIILFSPKFKNTQNNFIGKVFLVANGWHSISKNYRIIGGAIISTLFNFAIISFMIILEFKMYGVSLTIPSALILAALNSLSLIVSITPGSLGIKEAVLVFAAVSLGVPTTQSVAVSILDRVISTIVLFILGPIFSYILLKRKPTNERKN